MKSRENRVRRLARQFGWQLRKSRSRNPLVPHYGRYVLINPDTGGTVLGGVDYWYPDLDDVECYLTAPNDGE